MYAWTLLLLLHGQQTYGRTVTRDDNSYTQDHVWLSTELLTENSILRRTGVKTADIAYVLSSYSLSYRAGSAVYDNATPNFYKKPSCR